MCVTSRDEQLESLRRQLQKFSGDDATLEEVVEVTSTGISALDGLLPHAGIPRGGMVEWLTEETGAGAVVLAVAGVRAALEQGGWWVVVDRRGDFFPPAVTGWGVSLQKLLIVRPATARDAAWAFEQALRCQGVAVAWQWVESASERTLQRWKAAAAMGTGQGVLFRPTAAQRQASWADVRWKVTPLASRECAGRRLRVEQIYCRNGITRGRLELECDDEAGVVRVAAALADSATGWHAARA
ncbi:MAG: hypothetical protein V4719_15005 [Planctomycetota bacterium]